jgi:hypothetical protein
MLDKDNMLFGLFSFSTDIGACIEGPTHADRSAGFGTLKLLLVSADTDTVAAHIGNVALVSDAILVNMLRDSDLIMEQSFSEEKTKAYGKW